MTRSTSTIALEPPALGVRIDWVRAARRFVHAVCIALVVDLAYVVVAAGIVSSGLVREMDAASAALTELEAASASAHSLQATRWGAYASTLASRPSIRILGFVPFVGPEVEGMQEVTAAAGALADETAALTRDLDEAAGGEPIIEEVVDAGGFDLTTLAKLTEVVDEHAPLVRARVGDLAERARASAVVTAMGGDVAQARAAGVVRSLGRVQDALAVLPDMLGAHEARRYLLVFRSPSEARGGGGLPGVVGVLGARDGRLSISGLTSARRLLGGVDVPPRLAASEIARTYGRSAVEDWRNVNQSPNFPATARVMLELYRRKFAGGLDGVISMDPLALGHLAPALGEIRGEGWDVAITRDNARRVLLHDVYRHFNGAEHLQNRYFASLVDAVWTETFAPETDHAQLLRLLDEAADKQHLQVYMRDREEQGLVSSLGAGGASHQVPHTQVVFHNNWAGNKADFFLRRSVDTEIEIEGDLRAVVTTRIALENDVPDSELVRDPTVITKPAFGQRRELGTNRMILHVLLPRGARPTSLLVDGVRTPPAVGSDGGRDVVSEFLELPAGARAEVVLRYSLPVPVDGALRFTLVPQATVRPDEYSVRLVDERGESVIAETGRTAGRLKVPTTVTWKVR